MNVIVENPVLQNELIVPNTHTVNAKSLDEAEEKILENIMVENSKEGSQTKSDFHQIKLLTCEIRSIGQQGAILMGERIYHVKEILKSYRDGTFTKWLEFAIGSKKSGYNMLAYYELYQELPDHAKENFKKIPQKAGYILASRSGDINKKAEIVNSMHHLRSQEMISHIQNELPTKSKKASSSLNTKLLESCIKALEKIDSKDSLSDNDKALLEIIRYKADLILSYNSIACNGYNNNESNKDLNIE